MDRKTFAAVVALGLLVGAPLPAATLARSAKEGNKGGEVSKEDARLAITIFRRNPLNVQGELTQPIILRFAEDSPDVEIALPDKRVAWIHDKKVPDEAGKVLLVAYVAGDIQSQLDSGKAKDDPVGASEQVIATYRQLQKSNPKLKVREVEELIALQRQGKLAEHFKGD